MSWFRERKRHSLARYGIPSKTKLSTKEPNMTPLQGGLAEGQKPERYDEEQLSKGTEVEMEHTNNPYVARRIAMDHLEEHPEYYRHLGKMENRLEKKKIRAERKRKRKEERIKRKKKRRR